MHVVLSLEPGGTERLVIEIARKLAPGVQSVVCCLDQAGAWAPELGAVGVPVVTLSRRPGFQPGLGVEIARHAARHRIDVLHCHHYSPFVYGQIAALVSRTLKVVFTEHGRVSDAGPRPKRRLVNPLLGRLPSSIYAVSADLRRHMIAEGLPSGRVQVIHNGIEPGPRPTFADRVAARRALGVADDVFLIGAAGRLDPVKDLPTLIEAFSVLSRTHPSLRLVLIGDGPERARLEQIANTLGVAEAVTFTGYRSDVRKLLPALDLYANSSMQEGVSLTILEAMAAAMPVVATRVGGTPEVVVDGETGMLTPARSPEGLTAAFETLLRAPERRRSMADAARDRVARHFTVDRMAAGYLDAYLRQLKRGQN
jgi:glycosyltransferase involved in cell wall biosynthesis